MADPAQRVDPVTLEEFQAMRFGDRKAELIDGVIVVAQAFPTSRHGQIANAIGAHLFNAIRAGRLPCRSETGTGVEIRLERDYTSARTCWSAAAETARRPAIRCWWSKCCRRRTAPPSL